jgi:hypothetical protein
MTLTFLTPLGILLALGVLVPLLAVFLVRRHARRVRRTLGLSEPSKRRLLVSLVALLVAGVLVGLAAAQPVVEQQESLEVRTDAEVWVVLDVSRSMLAQDGTGSARRFDRAKTFASRLRASLSDMPVGIASMTSRVLPHLFPGANADVFEATLQRSLGIERPPPSSALATVATSLSSLATIRGLRYFSPMTDRRLVVVLTDGESIPVANARVGSLYRQPPAIDSIFVQFWGSDERVYTRGVPEAQYQPDPNARTILERLATSTRGHVFSEGDLGAATQKARELLGDGPTIVRGQSGKRVALAPYLAAIAFLPLGLLLGRRDR